jgi:quinol monooxygenase YgiN
MIQILIHHKVRDYALWKRVFDARASTRTAVGCVGGTVFRSHHDPNEIYMLLRWHSPEEAVQYVASTELRNALHDAGVIGDPQIAFLEEIGSVEP